MDNFDNIPIEYEEYDKNHFKLKCTETYFSNCLDHSKLNTSHYFIHVVKQHDQKIMSSLHFVCMRLVFANDCKSDSEIYMLPVASCKFGKDSALYVGIDTEQQLKAFDDCKYWQLEVLDQNNLYIFTAPKKPKLYAI